MDKFFRQPYKKLLRIILGAQSHIVGKSNYYANNFSSIKIEETFEELGIMCNIDWNLS